MRFCENPLQKPNQSIKRKVALFNAGRHFVSKREEFGDIFDELKGVENLRLCQKNDLVYVSEKDTKFILKNNMKPGFVFAKRLHIYTEIKISQMESDVAEFTRYFGVLLTYLWKII